MESSPGENPPIEKPKLTPEEAYRQAREQMLGEECSDPLVAIKGLQMALGARRFLPGGSARRAIKNGRELAADIVASQYSTEYLDNPNGDHIRRTKESPPHSEAELKRLDEIRQSYAKVLGHTSLYLTRFITPGSTVERGRYKTMVVTNKSLVAAARTRSESESKSMRDLEKGQRQSASPEVNEARFRQAFIGSGQEYVDYNARIDLDAIAKERAGELELKRAAEAVRYQEHLATYKERRSDTPAAPTRQSPGRPNRTNPQADGEHGDEVIIDRTEAKPAAEQAPSRARRRGGRGKGSTNERAQRAEPAESKPASKSELDEYELALNYVAAGFKKKGKNNKGEDEIKAIRFEQMSPKSIAAMLKRQVKGISKDDADTKADQIHQQLLDVGILIAVNSDGPFVIKHTKLQEVLAEKNRRPKSR